MGARRAGLNRVAFRRMGVEDGGGGGGSDWAGVAEAWAAETVGLEEGEYEKVHDPFSYPGQASATANFGAAWTVVVGAGAAIGHRTAGGVVWRGGVAVIEQNSGAWTANYLLWAGPGLIQDAADEKGGVIWRVRKYVTPPANPFNGFYVGLHDEAALFTSKWVMFGYDESVDPTFCFINRAGLAPVMTSFPLASLAAASGCEIALLQSGRLVTVYVDRVPYGSVVTDGTFVDLRPIYYANKGTFVADDALVLFNGAFA